MTKRVAEPGLVKPARRARLYLAMGERSPSGQACRPGRQRWHGRVARHPAADARTMLLWMSYGLEGDLSSTRLASALAEVEDGKGSSFVHEFVCERSQQEDQLVRAFLARLLKAARVRDRLVVSGSLI